MPDTWDRMGALVLRTLERIEEKQDEQTKQMAEYNADLRLLKFQMMMIGFVTGAVTSAVVSGVAALLMKK